MAMKTRWNRQCEVRDEEEQGAPNEMGLGFVRIMLKRVIKFDRRSALADADALRANYHRLFHSAQSFCIKRATNQLGCRLLGPRFQRKASVWLRFYLHEVRVAVAIIWAVTLELK